MQSQGGLPVLELLCCISCHQPKGQEAGLSGQSLDLSPQPMFMLTIV